MVAVWKERNGMKNHNGSTYDLNLRIRQIVTSDKLEPIDKLEVYMSNKELHVQPIFERFDVFSFPRTIVILSFDIIKF